MGDQLVVGVYSDATIADQASDKQLYFPERFRYDLVCNHDSVTEVVEDAPLYVDSGILIENEIDIVCMLSEDDYPDQYH